MTLNSWRNWLRQKWATPGRGPRRQHRPQFELLEDRVVPAFVWDGGGSTNLWSDRFNWAGDVAPATDGSADLEFGPGADPTSHSNTNNFTPGTSFNSITFTTAGYLLGGNRIVLGSGGITHDVPDSAFQNGIDLPLELTEQRNFTVVRESGPALRLNGQISGTGGIIKDGEGRLILASANVHTGADFVGQGTLSMTRAGALGSVSGSTTVLSGATLEVMLPSSVVLEIIDEPLVLGGRLRGVDRFLWSGDITLIADSRIESTNALAVVDGAIRGEPFADLTFAGPLTVAGPNEYHGFTTIESGTITVFGIGTTSLISPLGSSMQGTRVLPGAALQVGEFTTLGETLFLNGSGDGDATGALTVSVSRNPVVVESDLVIESDAEIHIEIADVVLTGSLSGNALATLRKDGIGLLSYAPAANEAITFAGRTHVADGVLTLATPNRNVIVGDLLIDPDESNGATVRLSGGGNQIADHVTVSFRTGGILDLAGHSDTIGGLDMTGGEIRTGLGVLGLAGNVAVHASSAPSLIGGNLNLGSAPRTFTVEHGSGADLVLTANVSGASGANFIKAGNGQALLQGNNTFAGDLVATGGIVRITTSTALGATTGSTTVQAGARLDMGAPLTVAETLHLSGVGTGNGALFATEDVTLTGDVFLDSASTIRVADADDVLTLSGRVRGQVTEIVGIKVERGTTLTKIGAGELVFTGSAANTNPGETRVLEGTLRLAKTVANGAIRGNLVVGDGIGSAFGPDGERVILSSANQIADTRLVTLNRARFLAGGIIETLGGLDLTGSEVSAGLLAVAGNVVSRAAADTSSINGQLSLGDGPVGTVRTWTVEDGAAEDDLQMRGTIGDGLGSSIGLDKAGPGTLKFGGGLFGDISSPNTFGGALRVRDGALVLSHADGVNAVGGPAVSEAARVVVGDGLGAAGSARLVLLGHQQIPTSQTVQIHRDGLLDLKDHVQALATLEMIGGQVETGAGILLLHHTVRSLAATDPAVINGRMALANLQGARFHVDDSPVLDDELIVNAVISGSPTLDRDGGLGRLVLTAANTYSGDTTVRSGALAVRGSLNNSAVRVSGSQPADNAVLEGPGSVKSLSLASGTVRPVGVLTVLEGVDFSGPGSILRIDLDSPTQFGQLVAQGGINLGNGTTELRVAPHFAVPEGTTFDILVNNSNTLTTGRFKDLPDDPDEFLAEGGQAFHVDYAFGEGNEVRIVGNTRATVTDVGITAEVAEGGVAVLSGRLVDPDPVGDLFLTVHWGDGSAPQTIHPGRDPFTLTHTYRDDNPSGTPQDDYLVRLTWGDGSGETRSRTELVRVVNVAPTVAAGGDQRLGRDGTIHRRGSVSDPGRDTFTATVDHGDGSGPERLRLDRDGRFHLRHRYREPGTYLVRVTVTDDDGGVGSDSFTVTVRPRRRHRS